MENINFLAYGFDMDSYEHNIIITKGNKEW